MATRRIGLDRLPPAARTAVEPGRARPVDWAWATRGAAWLDAGYWAVWLVAAGHTPASAERWAAEVPSWSTAPAEGVTAFAAANARLWSENAAADPSAWTRRLATAATTWHTYRRSGWSPWLRPDVPRAPVPACRCRLPGPARTRRNHLGHHRAPPSARAHESTPRRRDSRVVVRHVCLHQPPTGTGHSSSSFTRLSPGQPEDAPCGCHAAGALTT
ncbi:hypothetical protein GCM10010305_51280 [Streptomyces termitum]|uniref:Uncharacterized protein n=1 Tax=Streptomyces termitum TaxID=67368 RepID=A0A918T6R3_9ACTN|nr:hypothetical protein GCM10010305_51280 [Streptomyces termitum]